MSGAATIQGSPGAWSNDSGEASGRRFFDAASAAWMVKVFPGEFYVTNKSDEVLVTVLGSCVTACIRDPFAGVGGMNHFMLPQHNSGSLGRRSEIDPLRHFRHGKARQRTVKAGCSRERMEIKVFGGGNVTDTSNEIGTENAEFVLRYLAAEGLRCAAQDLGGTQPRRIHYYPGDRQSGAAIARLRRAGCRRPRGARLRQAAAWDSSLQAKSSYLGKTNDRSEQTGPCS